MGIGNGCNWLKNLSDDRYTYQGVGPSSFVIKIYRLILNTLKNVIWFSCLDHRPHKDCIIYNNIFIFSSIAENSYHTELADVLFRSIEQVIQLEEK